MVLLEVIENALLDVLLPINVDAVPGQAEVGTEAKSKRQDDAFEHIRI